MTHPHRLASIQAVRAFALAGNATLTLLSRATGARFTYKITLPDEEGKPYFVRLLRGPDNDGDFQFLGTIFLQRPNPYRHGMRSKIGRDAPSAKAFEWFWRQVQRDELPDSLEVWHEGRCGRCGRKLTVPSSIEAGIGPECADKMGYAALVLGQRTLPGVLQRQAE